MSTAHESVPTPESLVSALLACPETERRQWLTAHQNYVNISLITALKHYADGIAHADPQAADVVSQCALLVAEYCHGEPLAPALAAWVRGDWEFYRDPRGAIAWYEQALAGYSQSDDRLSVARLLTNLVFPYTECGHLQTAEVAVDEARAILDELGEPAAFYLMLLEQNAGWLLHVQGRYADALEAYARGLALAYQLDKPVAAAEIQVNRTLTREAQGRLAEVESALLDSRAVATRHGHLLTIARIDLNLGELYTAQGRPMEALRRLQTAHSIFAQLGNQMEIGSVLLGEAALLSRLGALRDAQRSYMQARDVFATLNLQPQVGVALVRGAIAGRKNGAYDQAARLLSEAAILWRQLAQPLWQATVAFEYAELALAQHDVDQALLLAHSANAPEDSSALRAQQDVLIADAPALRRQATGDDAALSEAREAYARALAYAQEQDDRRLQRRALVGAGRLAAADDVDECRRLLELAADIDDETRQTLSDEELIAQFQSQSREPLSLLTRLAIARTAVTVDTHGNRAGTTGTGAALHLARERQRTAGNAANCR
jgi:hypothetical protein